MQLFLYEISEKIDERQNTIQQKKRTAKAVLYVTKNNYFSTISRTSMGQALAQMPQEMHLEGALSSFMTITFMGQASTHLPHLTHSFLLIMYTPVLGF